MKIQRYLTMHCALLLLPILLIASFAAAEDKKKPDRQEIPRNPDPGEHVQCQPTHVVGLRSSRTFKRTSYSSAATPNIAGAKGDGIFCVKAGTTVTWQSTAKNTGFLIDFGTSSPFQPAGAITGGTEKSVPGRSPQPRAVTNIGFTGQQLKGDLRYE